MAVHGINFRSTSTYVTDGADDTYMLAEGSVTRGGITMAWDVPSSTDKRNRNSGIDVRLAGNNFNTSVAKRTLTVSAGFDAGTYDITLAIGDATYTGSNKQVEILDNTTSLFTVGPLGTTGTERWIDAMGTKFTSAAWPGSNAPKTGQVFSSTTFVLKTGDGVNANVSTIGHVHWTAAGGGGATRGMPFGGRGTAFNGGRTFLGNIR